MQKLAFGHLSCDSLADLDRGMSRSGSSNSVGSVMSDDIMPDDPGLSMAAAARRVFQAWEQNISTNTGCKSSLDLAALDKNGSPREAPLADSAVANASYFSLFFAALDRFLSTNAQADKEEALPRTN